MLLCKACVISRARDEAKEEKKTLYTKTANNNIWKSQEVREKCLLSPEHWHCYGVNVTFPVPSHTPENIPTSMAWPARKEGRGQ